MRKEKSMKTYKKNALQVALYALLYAVVTALVSV